MRLEAGARLGPYEILSPLGRGGMGEVYRARDTRLHRDVAVKVLPAHLSTSPDARKRLDKEAKAISQLSHPHVCTLFDVGHEGDVDYLVMELLAGESLTERLEKGSLPPSRVLELGAQLAEALHAAHQRGIVHRDLKVLDFGLASPMTTPAAVAGASEALTLSSPLAGGGAVAGTLPYMAPEQLEGRPADARSDVFSLGAVLYEMTTGRRAFDGPSPAAIASAIRSGSAPSPRAAQPSCPAELDRVIRTCLNPEPDQRWQSARDIGLQLEAQAESLPTSDRPGRRRRLAPWLLAGLFAALAFAAALQLRRPSSPGPPIRFQVSLPEGNATPYTFASLALALSPDGSRLAFVARPPGGRSSLWLRSLDALEPRRLQGTEGASSAFWSPDGRSLGFFAEGQLKRFDLHDETVVPLCNATSMGGLAGTWGRDGQILFSPIEGEAIYRVSTSGGEPTVEVHSGLSRGAPRLNWPLFLPDGRRFLYVARKPDRGGVLMLAEPGREPRELFPIFSNVAYVEPGYLLFVRGGTLLGQRFDPDRGQVEGEPFSIAAPVSYELTRACAQFAASLGGTVAYKPGLSPYRVVWMDRAGREVGRVAGPAALFDVRLSPDGKHAVFHQVQERTGTYDLWRIDTERGTQARLSSGEGSEFAGIWLPDGRGVVFSAPRGGPPHLYRLDITDGTETELLPAGPVQNAQDATPDGRSLIYIQRSERGDLDAWTLPLDGSGPPSLLLGSTASEYDLRVSPDGRYVSFTCDESGRSEVYVAPLPGAAPRTRVSRDGGRMARWGPDGKEIVFLAADRRLLSVPVSTVEPLKLGAPVGLFTFGADSLPVGLDVSPDGSRFLMTLADSPASEEPYSVLVNWPAAVDRPL